MKGNTIEDVYCKKGLKCTVKEYKTRDANDDTSSHHIIMYTTPDHEPVPIELLEDDKDGSIY